MTFSDGSGVYEHIGTLDQSGAEQLVAVKALAVGAFAALNAGDVEQHARLVADTAVRDLRDCDVIALAQSSMASAAQAAAAASGKPVLTSPDTAVDKMRRLLGSQSAAS